jgi:hypothetical protein
MGVSEGVAGSDAIPCETNLDPRNLAYRCGEPAELVILEGTLGPVQTWMCSECQILFRAHGYSVVPFLAATKIAN